MDRMVFFNVAWMKEYKGLTAGDKPVHGGKYIEDYSYGSEVYNFQPYKGKMYGFVEAGWKPSPCRINITKLGASKREQSISGVLVIWVARHCREPRTVVVGWYKDATVYRERQKPPEGSDRRLPDGRDAFYFVEADQDNCYLVPANSRDFFIGRGKGLLGEKNIWYADSPSGAGTKAAVLQYIKKLEKT